MLRRLKSGLLAVLAVLLAYAASQVHAGVFYEFGRYKEWHDANGQVIGSFYAPCPEQPGGGEVFTWGDTTGSPAVHEKWLCDPDTSHTDLCWKQWPATGEWMWIPCESGL